MPPIGDGLKGSILHQHFLKVLLGLTVIFLLAWASYHRWFKKEQAQIPSNQFQAADNGATER